MGLVPSVLVKGCLAEQKVVSPGCFFRLPFGSGKDNWKFLFPSPFEKEVFDVFFFREGEYRKASFSRLLNCDESHIY